MKVKFHFSSLANRSEKEGSTRNIAREKQRSRRFVYTYRKDNGLSNAIHRLAFKLGKVSIQKS